MTLTPEQQALSDALTKLQRHTVLGVVSGKSQRQAYFDAGGKAKNGDVADASVARMLANVKVAAFYNSLIETAAGNAIMSRTEAMERLSLMGRARITDVLEFEVVERVLNVEGVKAGEKPKTVTDTAWRIKESAELNGMAAAAIKSVTMTNGRLKVEMHDQKAAIELLGKMQGWEAPAKVDHTSTDGSMSPQGVGNKGRSLDDFYADAAAAKGD